MLIAVAAVCLPSKAQFDTWMLNQWLNDMHMDVYRHQQELGRQFQELVKEETERQRKLSTATCSMLPNGNDTFFGHITFLYLSRDRVKLEMTDASGKRTVLPSSSYFYVSCEMLTPAIFTPGSKLTISDKDTGKVYDVCTIPKKGTPEYDSFVRAGYAIANSLGSQGGGYSSPAPSVGGGSQSVVTTSTCSLCKGKGWIQGFKTPTYGNTTRQWCDECRMEVSSSHSHDRCPSCGGKGTIQHIR